jgi:predicted polyphosphate/ATP-dependent NAD kinase
MEGAAGVPSPLTRLGLLVNPIAGMGGRVGLHGTDGAALDQARELGAEPVSPLRARRALARLLRALAAADKGDRPGISVLAPAGPMGGDLLDELGWPYQPVPAAAPGQASAAGPRTTAATPGPTSGADTRRTVRAMAERGVTLLLFAGGDGTARDVAAGLAEAGGRPVMVTVLGVPAGVKMHSSVFALTPEAAADIAAAYLAAPDRVGRRPAEVVDRLEVPGPPQLITTMPVPAVEAGLQGAKSAGSAPTTRAGDLADLTALGREVAAAMRPGRLYLLGPGTTVAAVSQALGVQASLLGVDAVLDGRVLAEDAREEQLHRLLDDHPDATAVLGVIGGQGFLLGRGNQQLSPAILGRIGPRNVVILAAASKVSALDPPVLRVDIGDDAPARVMSGYHRVHTAPGASTVLKVTSG